jgi:Zn-dependent peptidase ImmA (M78 family)
MRKVLTDERLEKIALTWRRKLGVEYQLIPDIRHLLSVLPKYIAGFKTQILSEGYLRGYEAYTDCAAKTIFVGAATWNRLEAAEPRARMTLAHEIAHIVLRHSGDRFREVDNAVRPIRKKLETNEEFEARRFAGYFLAPTHLITRFRYQSEICAALKISEHAAEVRLDQIRTLERQRFPRQLPSSVIDFLEEKKKRGQKVLSLPPIIHYKADVDSKSQEIGSLPKMGEQQHRSAERGFLEWACEECKNLTLFKDGAFCTCATCGQSSPLR